MDALKANTLTPRERDIVRHIARGESCARTAAELGIRAFTVRKHRSHILAKLDLHSTAQLVAAALALYPQQTAPPAVDVHSLISTRERQVVELICEGLTSKQIARRLNLSPATVRKHRENIARKLRVRGLAAIQALFPSGGNQAPDAHIQRHENTSSEVFQPAAKAPSMSVRKG